MCPGDFLCCASGWITYPFCEGGMLPDTGVLALSALGLSLGAYATGLMTGPALELLVEAENGRAILFMLVLGVKEYLGQVGGEESNV